MSGQHSPDTIVALSSSTGRAARMIVRLSGPDAWAIVGQVVSDASVSLTAPISGASSFARQLNLRFPDSADIRSTGVPTATSPAMQSTAGTAVLQESIRLCFPAWLYAFAAPRSYTGEHLIELHIPGNPPLAKLLIEQLLRLGARSAEPGEFTARAYLNGRMGLTEAEGVAAAVSAANEAELAAARKLMSGELTRRLLPILDRLADTLALVEVGIDFSDEDVTFLPAAQLRDRLSQVDADLAKLLADSTRFEQLVHEPSVVLVGRPNAGKSTLLNALVGHDRAVVSPIAGTTRDVLSAEVALSRGIIRLHDVAGMESELNSIEVRKGGVDGSESGQLHIDRQMREKAMLTVQQADVVVLVRESTDDRPPLPLPRQPNVVVMSKCDLVGSASADATNSTEHSFCQETIPSAEADPTLTALSSVASSRRAKDETQQSALVLRISVHQGTGLPLLLARLDAICFGQTSTTTALALNARHVAAVQDARLALARAGSLTEGGAELVAIELREALDFLGAIGGKISADDLLGRIFGAFCIGK